MYYKSNKLCINCSVLKIKEEKNENNKIKTTKHESSTSLTKNINEFQKKFLVQ